MRPWYVQAESARWAPPDIRDGAGADEIVAVLYQAHAAGLVRLAVVILGDDVTAEDVVQDAFCGLVRRWDTLSDPAKALNYTRSAVINGCRTVQRYQGRRSGRPAAEQPTSASAEAVALMGEEHRAVLAAVRRLPPRQREAIALRFFADLDDGEIAQVMDVSRGTVKSTLSRGIAALGQYLGAGQ